MADPTLKSGVQAAPRSLTISERASGLVESVIREMTRLALQHGAVNLSQGFPDFPAPAELKQAAKRAIDADINQYAITWGAKNFRDALACKASRSLGWEVNPETEVTVCCGSTEGDVRHAARPAESRRRGGHL